MTSSMDDPLNNIIYYVLTNPFSNFQVFGDVPHVKTGATALHVSGAKGYIKVMGILLQAGAAVNAQVSILLIISKYTGAI